MVCQGRVKHELSALLDGQAEGDYGAGARAGGAGAQFQYSLVPVDDLFADPEAETSTAQTLGGKERLKYPGHGVGRHA
jgi:hypothetical protein